MDASCTRNSNNLLTALLATDEEIAAVEDERRECQIRTAKATDVYKGGQQFVSCCLNSRRICHILIMLFTLLGILSICIIFIWSALFGKLPLDEVPGIFPTREDTLAMATLSELIYMFHQSKESGDVLCQKFNDRNFTGLLLTQFDNITNDSIQQPNPPGDAVCHWYHHDWSLGSQVMIVESRASAYIAIVFCGTDDLQTSLTDVNIFRTRYGITSNGTEVIPNIDSNVLVHAGFDHAVFDDDLFNTIWRKVEGLLLQQLQSPPSSSYRIFTTGHSLGAADAILTAVGLLDKLDCNVTVLNFGCPRTGNIVWRDFVHLKDRLLVWRFVLGWDLVARLPEFYHHVGHTIQLSDHEADNITMRAYFRHEGDASLGYAGVPPDWSSTPYMWVPGALSSHHISRYRLFFENGSNMSDKEHWIQDFVKVDDHVDPEPLDDDFNIILLDEA